MGAPLIEEQKAALGRNSQNVNGIWRRRASYFLIALVWSFAIEKILEFGHDHTLLHPSFNYCPIK
jgi:hypothetical protein